MPTRPPPAAPAIPSPPGTVATAPRARPSSRSAETLRSYAVDWAHFLAWCRRDGLVPLPAEPATVAAYLTDQVLQFSFGTVGRRAAAIAAWHGQAGHLTPTAAPMVKNVLRQARRTQARRRPQPPSAARLAAMAARCPADVAGLRDRALLLLASMTGLPRAALVGLDAEAVRPTSRGVDLTIEASKAGGAPQVISLDRRRADLSCSVRALEDWLRVSATRWGPVFRKVNRWGGVEHARLGPDAVRQILIRRGATAPQSDHDP